MRSSVNRLWRDWAGAKLLLTDVLSMEILVNTVTDMFMCLDVIGF